MMFIGPHEDVVSADDTVRDDDGVRTVELLGGSAFLAVRDDDDSGVPGTACASSEVEARRRATRAWRIRREMRSAKPHGPPTDARGALSFGDFVQDPGELRDGPLVGAHGLVSGDAYELPLGVAVAADSQASLVCAQPGADGGVWVDGDGDGDTVGTNHASHADLEEATARIVGQDIVSRWWHNPEYREPPVVIRPDGFHGSHRAIALALEQRGLSCESYIFSVGRPVALTVLSRPDGSECTFGLAADPSSTTAAEESLCDAVHARLALQWRDHLVVEPLELARISAGWQVGGATVRHLHRRSRRTGTPSVATNSSLLTESWADLAVSRFDHEPVVVDWPDADDGHAARVLCPGADVYSRTDECVPLPVR